MLPEKELEIKKFTEAFTKKSQDQVDARILKEVLKKESFVWDLMTDIPKRTLDPMTLAYLRFPIKLTYEAIQESYKKM